MEEAVEKVARAICAESVSGFCADIGGDLGCKNRRGVAPHWTNCIASPSQLTLSGHAATARAAIEAMREPTKAMLDGGCEVGPDTNSGCFDYDNARNVYGAMIDAALA